MTLQPRLPILPDNAEFVGPELAFVREGGRLTFFNASGPIFTCREDDRTGVLVVAAVLSDPRIGLATTKALAKALNMHRNTVSEHRAKFEQ